MVSESLRLIKKFAGRKGGRSRSVKGFATNKKLASEAGKKGMDSRWHGKKEEPIQEQIRDQDGGISKQD